MRICSEYYVQINLYLDHELDATEKQAIESHLAGCRNCRDALNRERRFRESVQRTAPLHVAPESLRARITSLMKQDTANRSARDSRRGLPRWLRNVAAALVGVLFLYGLLNTGRVIESAQSATFADIAVDAHQRHALGQLPLELTSRSPGAISDWFAGKVPFSLRLPNYPEVSGEEKLYQLEGARLIGFKDDYVAFVAYEMGRHPISLVVTSSDKAQPRGGEQFASKGLTIHYETISGLKVLTWSHRGLTYALVSNLEERGEQSCLVCHQHSAVNAGSIDHLDSDWWPSTIRASTESALN